MKLIDEQKWLEQTSETLQSAVGNAFEAGGAAGQKVKNFLHGTWLGHPLHPMLTDIPIGAWTAALVIDTTELASGRMKRESAADTAIAVGLVGALGSALSGITDWRDAYGRAAKVGLLHAILNTTATALYATSLVLRKKRARRAGIGLSMLGYAISGIAAFLGGELVYGEQMGVDHTADKTYPEKFTPVMAAGDLPENELTRGEVDGVPVLLLRRDGRIHAIAETCSHMGGPLSEGKLEGDIVQCPWHGSRFCVRDGSVVDGPATYPQPLFETRVRKGEIEVRVARL
jgi:nitrite reductase/ring-hydroxylating ferredoxin subunit/uncharacterized membrane protein